MSKFIREKILLIYISLKAMPLFLKLISVFCFFGVLFAIGPFCPFMNFTINERPVSFREFWVSGAGPTMSLLGIILVASGVGIVYRKKWARLTFIAPYLGLLVYASVVQPDVIIPIVIFIIFLIWYLFVKKSVKEYFSLES